MKPRPTQFGARESTASPRQRVSRLATGPTFHQSRTPLLSESANRRSLEQNALVEHQDDSIDLQEEYPLTVREAAKYLGVSPQSVYLWVERKQIPHLRVMGRNIRFLKSDLETFRASFKQEMENA
jgi:excisionase family DNA binding protein